MTNDMWAEEPDESELFRPPSRRKFLAMMAGSALALALRDLRAADALAAATTPTPTPPLPAMGHPKPQYTLGSDFSVQLTRTVDMVDLVLRFHNLDVVPMLGASPNAKQLVKHNPRLAAYMVVEFPPQHVAEEALYLESEGEALVLGVSLTQAAGETAPAVLSAGQSSYAVGSGATRQLHRALPLRSTFSGPSRVAFFVSPTVARPLPFTSEALMNWSSPVFACAVVPAADRGLVPLPAGGFKPLTEPTALQTAIEFPRGLVLNPTPEAGWHSSPSPITVGSRTQVWSADITAAAGEPKLRAIWTYPAPGATLPVADEGVPPFADRSYLNIPSRNDKWQVLRQTTRRSVVGGVLTDADYLEARRFRLSSLGATVDMHGEFAAGDGVNLLSYVHRAFQGRDVFVRVVKAGNLYPTGHRAAQVEVMERVFATPPAPHSSTGPVAYLQYTTFIVVREHTRSYGTSNSTADSRNFPFTRVTIDLDTTPPLVLAPFPNAVNGDTVGNNALQPLVNGTMFKFPCTVTDKVGNVHRVDIPLCFVSDLLLAANWPMLAACYDQVYLSRRTIDMGGKKVGFAPDSFTDGKGSTSFPTNSIVMKGCRSKATRTPGMASAAVRLEALRSFANAESAVEFDYPDVYLRNGFDSTNQAAKVFARLTATKAISFGDVRNVGGLVSPDFDMTGISAAIGTFGGAFPSGVDQLPAVLDASGAVRFDPAAWFGGSLPKILGGIDLGDLLSVVTSPKAANARNAAIPQFNTSVAKELIDGVEVPTALTVNYHWSTRNVKNTPAADPVFAPGATASLTIDAVMTSKLATPDDPTADPTPVVRALAELRDFEVRLFGSGSSRFITLTFDSIVFTMNTGSDPQVSPNISGISFDGALSFVSALAGNLLPEGGLLSGASQGNTGGSTGGAGFTPILELDTHHVGVGFELGIPSIAMGAFSLSNLEFGMLVTLPFDATPMVAKFFVCRPDRPFMLSIGFLGGGGAFGVEVGLNGVRSVEVSLEFGANLEVDLGVASGGVSVVAGIHFLINVDPTQRLELTGYFRMNGRLEILGLITLSAEFLLSLTYAEPPGEAIGRASVSFTVEVAFFSTSVSCEVEKSFGGGGGAAAASVQSAARHTAGALGAVAPQSVTMPTVADYISAIEWGTYMAAFAN